MSHKNLFFSAIAALLLAVGFVACVKTEFDEPPAGGEPGSLTPNTTIAQLKALHISSGGFETITGDLIIGGEIVMDDRSGNFYKTLSLQDASGGIDIKFNSSTLYGQFPIGRKIFIRCKDLQLTDYNGLTQLIGSTVTEAGVVSSVGLTDAQVRTKVVKGEYAATPLAPKIVTANDIDNSMLSTFIRLEDVQFIKADTGQTYADVVTKFSLNRTLEDCSKQQLLVRTSGYANFASGKTPKGKGHIEGVLGVFGTTYQLYLRDEKGAIMDSVRCGATTGNETQINISDLRSAYTGSNTSAPANRKIKGIVTSDRLGKNLNFKNLYIQDGTAAIVIRFDLEHPFNLGDEVEIVVGGQELSEFNGLLQVNNVSVDRAKLISTGKSVTPRTATVAELNTNFAAWESSLVKIVGATITATTGTTLSGSRTINDGTGSIVMFTQSAATFSGTPLPGVPVTITAILSDFNGKQLILRNAADIQQ